MYPAQWEIISHESKINIFLELKHLYEYLYFYGTGMAKSTSDDYM